MKFDPSVPIYLQVLEEIKNDLISGKLTCGEKLPSGRDLAEKYTINPNTAARIYQEMERQDLCFTRRGMGTFVTEDPEMISRLKIEKADLLITQFLDGCGKLGLTKKEIIRMVEERMN